MKNNLLIYLLTAFLAFSMMNTFAQEAEAEEILPFQNTTYQQQVGFSVFDSQPVYNSPWEWLHETPQGNTLRWVKMWDANNWYAVGYGGTFIKTTDAGTSWLVVKDISGLDASGAPEIMYDAWFFDMNTGIAVGGGGACVKTTDGGVTWDSLSFFPTAATAYDVFFVDATLGFACGTTSMRAYKTTDGGNNWVQIWGDLPSTTCYSIVAFDENNVKMATSSGNFRYTTDGGTTWTAVSFGGTGTPYDMAFTDAMNGWICGSNDNPSYTTDGGLTWTQTTAVPTASSQYDIDILSVAGPMLLSEDFELTTFPPTGWTETGTTSIWDRSTLASGYGTGLASARAYFYGVSTGTGILTSIAFSPTAATDSLKFDHAYATYISEDDQLEIFTSTDAGSTWTSLVLLHGGVSGELVTAPPQTSSFVPSASQWATKTFALPVGTNMIRFDGITAYGNNLFIDNIQVGTPSVSSEVFVTGDPQSMYSTTDMGTTWTAVPFLDPSQPWTSTYYSSDFMADNDFVTVGAFGLVNSVTPLDGITCLTNFIKGGTLYDIFANSATGTVVAGGSATSTTSFDQAIYSADGGETWAVSTMMDSADLDFNSISMVSATTGYSAGEDHRVMKTTDGGATWFRVTDPATSTSDLETCAFVDENNGYVFGASGLGYKTTDGGTTWTPLTTGMGTSTIYGSSFLDVNTGYISGSSGKIFFTTDGGTTFNPQTTGVTVALYSIDFVNGSVGYASGSTGTVIKTTDGGTTWSPLDIQNTSPTLYSIEFKDENYGMVVGSVGRTFYTSDGGATWNFENTSMSTVYGLSIETTSADTSAAYVVGTNAYVMRNHQVIVPVELASFSASVNGNEVTLSWMTATELNNSGFEVERKTAEEEWSVLGFLEGHGTTSETQVYSYIDKELVVGTYNYRIKQIDFNGTYKYYELSEEINIAAPNSYDLSQNYPNPFNPTTKIKYSVPVDGFVNIAVYNVLGEKVADLVNSIQKAGNYEFTFNATNLASGMYIYRMESGSFISIKKMMILK